MVIFIKKLLTFFLLFFTFNTLHIDSNYAKRLVYDSNDLYDVSYHTIYFINASSSKIKEKLEYSNINVLSYIIDGKKYYARNIDELEKSYFNDIKIYGYNNEMKIDGITTLCSVNDLIRIDNLIDIY